MSYRFSLILAILAVSTSCRMLQSPDDQLTVLSATSQRVLPGMPETPPRTEYVVRLTTGTDNPVKFLHALTDDRTTDLRIKVNDQFQTDKTVTDASATVEVLFGTADTAEKVALVYEINGIKHEHLIADIEEKEPMHMP